MLLKSVLNLKRKLVIESDRIRLRYVFCWSLGVENIIIIIIKFKIIIVFFIKKSLMVIMVL